MAIPPCGTFDYVAIVPGDLRVECSPWMVRLRDPIECTGDHLFDFRLVGISPRLEITDAGLTPETTVSRFTGTVYPKVLRSKITLTASEQERATVSAVSFYVDKGLTSALRPGDVVYMSRTGCGRLGVSVTRDDKLVAAVGAITAVPLGRDVQACPPLDLIKQTGERVMSLLDLLEDIGELVEIPIEVRVEGQDHILSRGRRQLGQYVVFVEHGFYVGMPGVDECMALSRVGACAEIVANASALLLDTGALEMVEW